LFNSIQSKSNIQQKGYQAKKEYVCVSFTFGPFESCSYQPLNFRSEKNTFFPMQRKGHTHAALHVLVCLFVFVHARARVCLRSTKMYKIHRECHTVCFTDLSKTNLLMLLPYPTKLYRSTTRYCVLCFG
jgi:hypothetical protein